MIGSCSLTGVKSGSTALVSAADSNPKAAADEALNAALCEGGKRMLVPRPVTTVLDCSKRRRAFLFARFSTGLPGETPIAASPAIARRGAREREASPPPKKHPLAEKKAR